MQQILDGSTDSDTENNCELIRQALLALQGMKDIQLQDSQQSTPPLIHIGFVGRPRFDITVEQLRMLIESRFTVPQIADLIGVSPRTVYRRMSESRLSISSTYSDMTDSELDDVIHEIHQQADE